MPVGFRAGDTFLYPLDQSRKEHVWIIATERDTGGQFVIVSLTSLRGSKDQTVILFAREHDFVRHDTCVHYASAELSDSARLQSWLDRHAAQMHRPMRPDILKLIGDGFAASDFTKKRIVEFIRAYRLR